MKRETSFGCYSPRAFLRVGGGDAAAFLQGQFTNDLKQSGLNAVYGLWLSQKGRVLADSQVLCLSGTEFVIVSIFSPAAIIQKRLEQYIVADEVEVTDETEDFRGLALGGPGCAEQMRELFGEVPPRGQFRRVDDLLGFAGRRMTGSNFEIVGPAGRVAELRERLLGLNCREATAGEWERARIVAGIPAVPEDIGPADLPHEGGLEDVAISYTKGCFLGQEVMARLKNRGQVRRRLHVVRGGAVLPKPHDVVFQNAQKVGEIRSATASGDEFVALAMLTLLDLDLKAGLSFVPTEPATVRIIPHG